MEFDQSVQNYLTRLDFSNGLSLDIAKKENNILDRISILEQLSKDKKIIHLGFCFCIPAPQNNNIINRIHPKRFFLDFIFKHCPPTRQTLVMVVVI